MSVNGHAVNGPGSGGAAAAADEEERPNKRSRTQANSGGGYSSGSRSSSSEIITVTVRNMTDDRTVFKINKNTRFEVLFSTYARMKRVDVASFRFLNDGERINPRQTPAEWDMEDGDEIDCMLEQGGD